MRIFLVRHTEYDNPKKIYPFHLGVWLSDKGRHKAIKLGKWLAENGGKHKLIISSPIVRCLQMAELIAGQTDAKVITDERLIETRCPGLQGQKMPNNGNPWAGEMKDKTRESYDSILKRMLSIYKERIRKGEDCVLVSHGDPNSLLFWYLAGKKIPYYIWDEEERWLLEKGSVVRIVIEAGKLIKVEKVNWLK